MPASSSSSQWALELYSIGPKLRLLRRNKRLTLSRLAVATGLSTALLSKLETEQMIPTLLTLSTICRVYGVGLNYFFCEPEHHIVSVTRKTHMQAERRKMDTPQRIELTASGCNGRLSAEALELTSSSPIALGFRDGKTCAFVYVIEGRLQFRAGGATESLESGDSVYVESSQAIAWNSGEKRPCRILVVRPEAEPALPGELEIPSMEEDRPEVLSRIPVGCCLKGSAE